MSEAIKLKLIPKLLDSVNFMTLTCTFQEIPADLRSFIECCLTVKHSQRYAVCLDPVQLLIMVVYVHLDKILFIRISGINYCMSLLQKESAGTSRASAIRELQKNGSGTIE